MVEYYDDETKKKTIREYINLVDLVETVQGCMIGSGR